MYVEREEVAHEYLVHYLLWKCRLSGDSGTGGA